MAIIAFVAICALADTIATRPGVPAFMQQHTDRG